MENKTLHTLIHEAWQAIYPHYETALERFVSARGVSMWGIGLMLAAISFEPKSTTPARMRVRGIYTTEQAYLDQLRLLVGQGCMLEAPQGEFFLTPPARAETLHLLEDVREQIARADPLPLEESQRVAELCGRLVKALLAAPPPPGDWSIGLSYRLMPDVDPPLPYIEQAVSCLTGYREDAHIAAWQPGGLSAPTIEALTFLWRGEADSLDSLCQKLERRGHSRQVYAGALAELRKRGFLEGTDESLRLTGEGKTFREQIEQETDNICFAHWSCLSDEEKDELGGLLTRLHAGLTKKA